ncbi:MAG TPA: hypothetical protein VNA68_01060, partial [Candidatus Dormibacteraeota bacterium]|nr:hypothetical protein [Candidatus Dormibacteraeota bacterium]
MVVEGKLSEGHARALLPVDDARRQIESAELVIKNGWTARQTEEFVRNLKQDQATPAAQVAKRVASTNELTKGLQNYLGTKVTLQPTAKGGKLLIEYKSEDQLEEIYRTIKGEG